MTKVLRVQENSYLSLVSSVLNLMFMNIFLETFLVFLRVCVLCPICVLRHNLLS